MLPLGGVGEVGGGGPMLRGESQSGIGVCVIAGGNLVGTFRGRPLPRFRGVEIGAMVMSLHPGSRAVTAFAAVASLPRPGLSSAVVISAGVPCITSIPTPLASGSRLHSRSCPHPIAIS